jgi:chemotaxis protein histidine kinase CheA/CheY-like chemotaxis protein
MLLAGFDRLRHLVMAKLTEAALDEREVLQEANDLFAQLRARLGKYYGQQNSLPTPPGQGGFDLVQAIFEVGVQKRLEALGKILLKSKGTVEIATNLRSEFELLVGLADSLNLPGFAAIAKTALTALEARPQEATTIARVALDNLLQGQEQVLAGDRERGGEPSPELLKMAEALPEATHQPQASPSEDIWGELELALAEFESEKDLPDSNAVEQLNWDSLTELTESLDDSSQQAEPGLLLEQLWDDSAKVQPASEPERADGLAQSDAIASPTPLSEQPAPQTVRVKLEGLKRIDRALGEIQVHHNRQSSDRDRLHSILQDLIASQKQHQQTIERLRDWVEKLASKRNQIEASPEMSRFAAQERNSYGELESLARRALAETGHLQATMESLEQITNSSQQAAQKQQRLVSDLQEDLIETRMVSLEEVLSRFRQTVRQLEIVHLKPVQLQLSGTNVLVDKAIAEKLYAPLLHLIRNAFDHGIEPTEVRRQHRKSEVGQIEIRAYQQGWQTVIEVKDDGQGLDFERIRDRVVALNLFDPEVASQLSTQQLSDLLFEPRFSTSSTISELSGRGIGLETVKAEVEALDGTCTVQSEPYRGTTFSLRFPMTLTIVKLTVVQAGEMLYALLSNTVEKIMLPDERQIVRSQGRKFLSYRLDGDPLLVPVHKLSELIAYGSPIAEKANRSAREAQKLASEAQSYLLLLRYGEKRLGLEVDRVFGEQKTAIKPLGSAIAPPSYVYGCSVLDRDRLALAIDGSLLVQQAQTSARQNVGYAPPYSFKVNLQSALPLRNVPSLAPETPVRQTGLLPSHSAILVVDDSISQRQQTASLLQKAGYRIVQAKNGLDAIEQLQMERQKIQLVVCDIEMPHLNGFEFLSYCRHREEWATLPIVMLANRGGRQHRKIALGLGATAYFTRPYIESDLLSAIESAIASS